MIIDAKVEKEVGESFDVRSNGCLKKNRGGEGAGSMKQELEKRWMSCRMKWPRLTEDKKEELEEGIVKRSCECLGDDHLDEFIDDKRWFHAPRLEEDSLRENTVVEQKAITLRGTLSQKRSRSSWSCYNYGPYWFRASVVRASSLANLRGSAVDYEADHAHVNVILTLLLIVASGREFVARASRRPGRQPLRWAEAIEYMDAFPDDS
ncbi:hypothetical protein GQ600_12435 [Phytophthora cactorum]|nr:hypothetical protein GQ600_12435 [Phytophthora cactorum]